MRNGEQSYKYEGRLFQSSQVTSIYTAFNTIQIVSKQLHGNEQENAVLLKVYIALEEYARCKDFFLAKYEVS